MVLQFGHTVGESHSMHWWWYTLVTQYPLVVVHFGHTVPTGGGTLWLHTTHWWWYTLVTQYPLVVVHFGHTVPTGGGTLWLHTTH
jgi:hypothetical protein